MPVSVTVKITGDKEEIAKLKKLGHSLHDFSKAMDMIGNEVVRYYSGQGFASQGGVFNNVWPSLNPLYAKQKAVDYPGRGILVKTGDMQRDFIYKATSKNVTISNTAPYFKYHQSTEPRSKMPYRPMMIVNDEVKGIIEQIIQQDIKYKLALV